MTDETRVQILTPVNRLSACVDAQGGWTFDELVSSANKRVADMSDALLTYVAEQTEELLYALQEPDETVFENRHSIAACALCLAEVAGCVGLDDVGDVAKGIVLLIQGQGEQKSWNRDAVRVHATTLALISRTPSNPGLKHIVSELASLREAVGVAGL